MNILLHICCAPCAIYPVEELRKEGHKVIGFFYNPNIHPYSEYIKRKEALEIYSKESGLDVVCGDYAIEYYFQHIAYNEALKNRCPMCWWLRLEKTAKHAGNNGFDSFTTTLLGSPYQDHDIIKTIYNDVIKNSGLKSYYKDFRPGFRKAHDLAKEKKIYCQNYCGCLFSEKERAEKKKKDD